jgi:NCAIR mutase (PurE)-related proteins
MDREHLKSLLTNVREGSVDVEAAIERLRHMPFEDLDFAKVDHHRAIRQGMPEVIFGQGKTPHQISEIAASLLRRTPNILITRADHAAAEVVCARFPDAEYFPLSRAIRVWTERTIHGKGRVAVICAGTSDLPVAEEARVTVEVMGKRSGCDSRRRCGGHPPAHEQPGASDAGQGDCSMRGHGRRSAERRRRPGGVSRNCSSHQRGIRGELPWLAALLGMLNSCASNVTVVNIDNGFGAGYVASLINRV